MGRAFRRRKARRDRAEAQCELPTSPPPPPPERLPCGCWNRPELYSKACPQHQAQAEFLSDQREDREAREVAKEFPPALALLEVAVPLWIERLRPLTWEEARATRRQEQTLFDFLPEADTPWDGHSTEDKYRRLSAWHPQARNRADEPPDAG